MVTSLGKLVVVGAAVPWFQDPQWIGIVVSGLLGLGALALSIVNAVAAAKRHPAPQLNFEWRPWLRANPEDASRLEVSVEIRNDGLAPAIGPRFFFRHWGSPHGMPNYTLPTIAPGETVLVTVPVTGQEDVPKVSIYLAGRARPIKTAPAQLYPLGTGP